MIPSQQNLKGICISVLVIKVVLGLVSLSVFLMTPPDLGPRVHGVRMSLHNITSDSLKPNTLNATWVSGGGISMTIYVLLSFFSWKVSQTKKLVKLLPFFKQKSNEIFKINPLIGNREFYSTKSKESWWML